MEREDKPEFNCASLDLKYLEMKNGEKGILQFIVFEEQAGFLLSIEQVAVM